MVVGFILTDQAGVEPTEKISERVEKLCPPVGVHGPPLSSIRHAGGRCGRRFLQSRKKA
jgi:hypothetical protein